MKSEGRSENRIKARCRLIRQDVDEKEWYAIIDCGLHIFLHAEREEEARRREGV